MKNDQNLFTIIRFDYMKILNLIEKFIRNNLVNKAWFINIIIILLLHNDSIYWVLATFNTLFHLIFKNILWNRRLMDFSNTEEKVQISWSTSQVYKENQLHLIWIYNKYSLNTYCLFSIILCPGKLIAVVTEIFIVSRYDYKYILFHVCLIYFLHTNTPILYWIMELFLVPHVCVI